MMGNYSGVDREWGGGAPHPTEPTQTIWVPPVLECVMEEETLIVQDIQNKIGTRIGQKGVGHSHWNYDNWQL